MNNQPKTAVIISASSDIGTALCHRWHQKGWRVIGTYRSGSPAVEELKKKGVQWVRCDLADEGSLEQAYRKIEKLIELWDVLILCPGTQEPIGEFTKCDFDDWENSLTVNFTAQMRLIHMLLPLRNPSTEFGPCVLLFAGGGTNNATVNYSAYTISKIASIKMCELLDAEVPDTRFVILGPGWVKTKIHDATLKAKEKAGANYQRTVEKLAGEECVNMEKVVECCEWLIGKPHAVIGGRNFSLVFDPWGRPELEEKLISDLNMYKLRRAGNEWRIDHG